MITAHRFISLFFVVALVVASAGPALAQSDPSSEEMKALLEEGLALYNENADQFDVSFAEDLLAGKTVNVYIEDGDQTHVYSAVIEDDMQISNVATGPNSEASTRITTDRETLETIASSSDPLGEVEQAVRDDRIRVSGEEGNLIEQAIWTVANLFKGILF
ncbi:MULTISPECIES: hypothetical protein [Haloferax]|uniref:SCP2 domain-containing protein n=1 Tax=Haloferax marinum TaxID=2666143 RepID=A0A6A8GCB2_9EURY|nr:MULTISPECIES: hypothetical protein [Haloferax]KAB1198567.1 hypothetical protein Hfx1150_14000 [Haloferax sp. CBA1150]MRW97676.1 hypothetical protein [Haloferax marinum]